MSKRKYTKVKNTHLDYQGSKVPFTVETPNMDKVVEWTLNHVASTESKLLEDITAECGIVEIYSKIALSIALAARGETLKQEAICELGRIQGGIRSFLNSVQKPKKGTK
jgi:hypothetical protein